MLKMKNFGDRGGWTLPDALIALSIVALTVIMVQQVLMTTQEQTQRRTHALLVARQQHDQALERWLAQQ
ncbi:hypothetical protein [Levilactobacillus fujinensis]|uniref:Uncharacterized protein n=1 Tax=Levilactobacillus fujinensis TaxID=2486024 RepID=A0ABW1TDN6_9LACO|nr:hypothetical protein [Levilactobacillus fujinensis]